MKILKKDKYSISVEVDYIKDTLLETIYKQKTVGPKLVLFIACVADLSKDNPYSSLKYTDKKDILTKRFFKTDKPYEKYFTKKQREVIEKGIEVYDELFNSTMDRDLATYNIKMDQLNDMLKPLVPIIRENVHDMTFRKTFSTNIDIINKVLLDIVNLIEAKVNIVKTYNKEATIKVFRGKSRTKKTSPLEKGLLT